MTSHILILCTHNSARSVLSEGMLNHWAKRLGRDVKAHSAGSAPSAYRMLQLLQLRLETLSRSDLRAELVAIGQR
jgi:protein-tyrosine-phosphatase